MVIIPICYDWFDKLQRELKGYKFPVYTTKSCPRNETEWDARSSEFNCQGESSYACFPNENITELLEFCYPLEVISITKGKNITEQHILFEFLDYLYLWILLLFFVVHQLIIHLIII